MSDLNTIKSPTIHEAATKIRELVDKAPAGGLFSHVWTEPVRGGDFLIAYPDGGKIRVKVTKE